MHKILLRRFLFICSLSLAAPLHAAELKFASPADLTRSLTAVAAPTSLSVVSEEGGFLRFHSDEKSHYCQMDVTPGGAFFKLGDGEIDATFRFGGEKQSFGLYFRVAGNDEPAYLALASVWTQGQGVVRLFKVLPKAQVEDQHQIGKETVGSPLVAGAWYTLKVKTAAQSGQALQITVELVPATGAATTVTAVDPNGLSSSGVAHIRFYSTNPDANIDLKQISTPPTASTPVGKPAKR